MIEGYEVPLHRSLAEVILMGGVPRTLVFLLWTTAAALGFGLRQIWVVPVALVLHLVFAAFAKRDAQFFEVFVRAMKAPGRMEP
ncbi:VirB3 family type IV secretion system protein [Prosthecochloris sp. N3]|uniref:VirB3 family type IV secretion system protein n=1 Tax=Prosthecochloris ethylica TaxID=2743976 RepID=A0ABR9XU83_9CHLB|nr:MULTISPECIES: VirB3 family type IV secretion system protein [Prosthecochloris]MBF0587327.1 VirB3 family type IV secretion system protein [Prosthecochloris ethylica]MBF0637578.1 VirB3 family type IV secretion system protein [Prosthecochloris ethylica]NUK48286.1 VirB3 family type IV secretion system protein [Prosthecochloris ethylica]RNA64499.1 conjugal transfer protein [Prosthecochloris sp. ZM_2]